MLLFDSSPIQLKCSRDRPHVPIQGKFTKGLVIYVDGLAHVFAISFHKVLTRKLRIERYHNERKQGLENPLCSEVLVA